MSPDQVTHRPDCELSSNFNYFINFIFFKASVTATANVHRSGGTNGSEPCPEGSGSDARSSMRVAVMMILACLRPERSKSLL